MGLVFVLQPDPRRSQPGTLAIRSSKKKFGLGGSFVFGGALIGTMFLAALPLFRIFWEQGNFWDRLITLAVIAPIVMYPVLAIGCWFYQEAVTFHRKSNGLYDVEAFESVFGVKWHRREARGIKLDDLRVENWMGAQNVAAIAAAEKGRVDRYGTRGHWMLKVTPPGGGDEIILERRAKRDEIDFLKAQIEIYFEPERMKATPAADPNPGVSPVPHT